MTLQNYTIWSDALNNQTDTHVIFYVNFANITFMKFQITFLYFKKILSKISDAKEDMRYNSLNLQDA